MPELFGSTRTRKNEPPPLPFALYTQIPSARARSYALKNAAALAKSIQPREDVSLRLEVGSRRSRLDQNPLGAAFDEFVHEDAQIG